MVRAFFISIIAYAIGAPTAWAGCRYGPEGVEVCDVQDFQANLIQKAENEKAEADRLNEEALRRQDAYCAANPSSTDCREPTSRPLQCPPGQVSTGGPVTSAMCVPDVPIPTPRPENDLKATPGSETAATPRGTTGTGRTPVTPANQDAQVSPTADRKATQCKDLAASASSTCDSAMNRIRSLSSQVSSGTPQAGASGCSQMGTTANNVANQMQSERDSCQGAVSSCNSICDSALDDLSSAPSSGASVRASQGRSRCQSASSFISNMDLNINQARSAAAQANQCYQQITGSPIPGLNTAEDFAVAPTPTPALDCSNPEIAVSNPVCLCRSNPSHPACGSSTASSQYLGAGAVKPGTTDGSGPMSPSPLVLGDSSSSTLPEGYVPSRTGRMAQRPGGVGQVGGAGGNAPTAGGTYRGARVSRYDTQVLKGGSGSGSRAPGARGGGYVDAKAEGAWPSGSRTGRGTAAGPSTVDLRKFLPPDGRSGSRGPAGLGNGIGPRHTNIWSTVNGRYGRLQDSLDP